MSELSAQDIEGVLLGTAVNEEFVQQKFGQGVDVLLSTKLGFCHLSKWNDSIFMDVPLSLSLGGYKLDDRQEISTTEMYEWFGDDVDGIGIGQKVAPELIVSKFGEPSEIKAGDYWDEPVTIYVYSDGEQETCFAFSTDFRMVDYSIGSPEFKTFTDHIPEGLCVGDPIEKASALFDSDGRPRYRQADDYPFLKVENGVVKKIEYFMSD